MSYYVITGFKGKVASLKFTDRKGVPCSANRPVLVKVCSGVHLLVYLRYSFVSAVPIADHVTSIIIYRLTITNLRPSPQKVHGAVQVPGPL